MSGEAERAIRSATIELWAWQPQAHAVKEAAETCPCCHSGAYLTYIIPICREREPLDITLEYCGYYCSCCDYGSSGARKKG